MGKLFAPQGQTIHALQACSLQKTHTAECVSEAQSSKPKTEGDEETWRQKPAQQGGWAILGQ